VLGEFFEAGVGIFFYVLPEFLGVDFSFAGEGFFGLEGACLLLQFCPVVVGFFGNVEGFADLFYCVSFFSKRQNGFPEIHTIRHNKQ